jgi:RNA polymerase sigma factor (TIGR02999 family)
MPKTDGEAGDITQLLIAHRQGEKDVLPRLVPMVYEDLKRLARLQMRGHRGATLDSGALAHEAYLRLVDQSRADWNDRRHFFAVAAMAMRQIVADHARRRRRQKRGAGIRPATLVDAADPRQGDIEEILSIDGVLDRLEHIAPRQVRRRRALLLRRKGPDVGAGPVRPVVRPARQVVRLRAFQRPDGTRLRCRRRRHTLSDAPEHERNAFHARATRRRPELDE